MGITSIRQRYGVSIGFVLLFLIISPSFTIAQQKTGTLSGRLWDITTSRGADVMTVVAEKDSIRYRVISDANGRFSFGLLPAGTYKVSVASILYRSGIKTVHLQKDHQIDLVVEKIQRTLPEVYITASEAKGMTSTSVIDRRAMQHLQPSSFTDLLELLPGGRARDPQLTSMNKIKLREAGIADSKGEYAISSLGTAFLIDGAPINTTANLQNSSNYFLLDPNESRNSTNRGVDMRSISTDQIEKVEIVRGIPSVEYGDLTSGLVKIERKKGATPYSARMKTDGFSKLFSLGKGFYIPAKDMTLNVDLGYLNAKADPRDNFENYKRINSSIRMEKRWLNDRRQLKWNAALDYTTTIDNKRADPDNGYAPVDRFKSTFNSYGITSGLKNEVLRSGSLVKFWEVSGKLSYQWDKIDAVKWVQAKSAAVLINSLTEGEHDVNYITPSYASKLLVDGQPLNAFFKAMTLLEFKTAKILHQVKLGLETNYSKNYGAGQVYDLDYPTIPSSATRPRAFDSIPGMLNQSFFAEDMLSFEIGKHKITTAVGLRGMMLPGMDKQYDIANKLYLDPRINTRWALPRIAAGSKTLFVTLGAGYGLHTKMPTLEHLYPNARYLDIVQLNFYHNNPEYRKANAVTYIINRANYNIQAAVNRKLELNADFALDGNRLSVTYFHEKLTSGFRDVSRFKALTYKDYDNTSVDAGNLTAPPATSDFTYENKKRFFAYGITTNGSALIKEGVEFQFTSKRLPVINTRFTVNGAWFNTTYINSNPLYKVISEDAITNGNILQYTGVYDDTDGYLREQFNTNLIIDSYLPKLGLILSGSVQNIWFSAQQSTYKSGTPLQYIDIDGNVYPYTKESASDPNLNWLQQTYNKDNFLRRVIPIDLQVNIKATKEFKKKAAISMFVNRLFTYSPNYTFNNVIVRRKGFSSP